MIRLQQVWPVFFCIFVWVGNIRPHRRTDLNFSSDQECIVIETVVNCTGIGNLTADTIQVGTFTKYTEAIINEGFSGIGEKAFQRCAALVNVSLPMRGLLYIGPNAFANCDKLERLVFPSTLTDIAGTIVNGSPRLTHIIMSSQTGSYTDLDGILLNSDGNLFVVPCGRERGKTLTLPSVNIITGYACRWGKAKKVVIPAGVKTVEQDAFYGSELTELEIGKDVEDFNTFALTSCSNLDKITLNSTTYLYEHSNTMCTYYGKKKDGEEYTIFWVHPTTTELTIPKSVMGMNDVAVQYCQGLKTCAVEDGSTRFKVIGQTQVICMRHFNDDTVFQRAMSCVGGASKVRFYKDSKVTAIGNSCFRDCKLLTEIIFYESITEFGGSAMRYCTALQTVDFAGSTWGSEMPTLILAGCSSLTSVLNWPTGSYHVADSAFTNIGYTELELPSNMISLGSNACSNQAKLTKLTIPTSIKSLGAQAFNKCPLLTEVTFKSGSKLTTIGSMAFANCPLLETIELPESVTTLTPSSFAMDSSLTSITFTSNTGTYRSDGVAVYKSQDGIVYHTLIVCPPGLEEMKLLRDTRVIGTNAFYGCTKLVYVNMNDNIKRIERGAFFECSVIQFVRLAASITYIGHRAFDSCARLRDILYCSNRTDVDFSEGDPFPTNPNIYLFSDYPNETFCGHECQAILDRECNIPTMCFTYVFNPVLNHHVFKLFASVLLFYDPRSVR